MNCDKKYDLLAYSRNEVSQKENSLITSHLESCSECRYELDSFKQTVSYLENMDEINPSVGFDDFWSKLGSGNLLASGAENFKEKLDK